ncbi:universal stress protein UspA [Mycobacterium holsaticum DSM 44478]|nr:universal stress protein UspA [Mycolicibacterium holsaticum DSM 44478 = JCM 12374]
MITAQEREMSEPAPPRGVVVGTDGSESARAAVRWAAHEAAMRDAPLTIVHVVAAGPVMAATLTWPAGAIPTKLVEAEKEQGRAVLAEAVKDVDQMMAGRVRPQITAELFFGAAVPTLVASSAEAQMLVVGSRGRTEWQRRLLGSVTNGLLHHAHCPVAVIHGATDPLSAEFAQRPVLVGFDGSAASESAVGLAFDEADLRGVELMALHVLSDAEVSSPFDMEWSALQSVGDQMLSERLAVWQDRHPEVAVQLVVEFDRPARQLVDHAERAQLVVVGSRGRGGFVGMLLGSVSNAVAQESPVPVIVARPR